LYGFTKQNIGWVFIFLFLILQFCQNIHFMKEECFFISFRLYSKEKLFAKHQKIFRSCIRARFIVGVFFFDFWLLILLLVVKFQLFLVFFAV
jgi:hypothetical protein